MPIDQFMRTLSYFTCTLANLDFLDEEDYTNLTDEALCKLWVKLYSEHYEMRFVNLTHYQSSEPILRRG